MTTTLERQSVAAEVADAIGIAMREGLHAVVTETITVACPRCGGSLNFSRNHLYPVAPARLVNLFTLVHGASTTAPGSGRAG
jgi:hypothetical protein